MNRGRRSLCCRPSRRQRGHGVPFQPAAEDRPRPPHPGHPRKLRIAIVTWIERPYHRRRRQASLDRLTPSNSRPPRPRRSPKPRDRTCHPNLHQSRASRRPCRKPADRQWASLGRCPCPTSSQPCLSGPTTRPTRSHALLADHGYDHNAYRRQPALNKVGTPAAEVQKYKFRAATRPSREGDGGLLGHPHDLHHQHIAHSDTPLDMVSDLL